MRLVGCWLGLGLALLSGACTSADSWEDPTVHDSGFVTVDGLQLNYLDWGGVGPPVVLLHGAWASPHVFDALAPLLARQHRVVAFARRGHGQSDDPTAEFDVETLTEDLRQVMDSLEIDRAHLIGWSVAGYELTRFAVKYPERTETLVYIEAHYEFLEDDPAIPFPLSAWDDAPPLGPSADNLRSVGAYLEWYYAVILPDVERRAEVDAWLRDRLGYLADGSVLERRPAVVQESFDAMVTRHRRQYGAVAAPALALFAEQFLAEPTDPDLRAAVTEWNARYSLPGQDRGRARLRSLLPMVEVKSYGDTSHESILLKDVANIATDILEFLERNLSENRDG